MSVAAVPSQSVEKDTLAAAARSNRNIMHGPDDPKGSTASGQTALLFGLAGATVIRVGPPPTAGMRFVIFGAVCQLLDAAHRLPVVVMGAVVNPTVSPGT